MIVDETGTLFGARAEKQAVRVHIIGAAGWNRVRDRLTEARCNAAAGLDEPRALFDSLERGHGLTR